MAHRECCRFPRRQKPHLTIAGEGCVVKQEVSTEEEHDGVEDSQEGPVDEDPPPQQGVFGDVPAGDERENFAANVLISNNTAVPSRNPTRIATTTKLTALSATSVHKDMLR